MVESSTVREDGDGEGFAEGVVDGAEDGDSDGLDDGTVDGAEDGYSDGAAV